ncbi:hypothetical protein [Brachyspira aalborgi]|uniref:Uncharacterized protein n=1 Tax=Brachyspira aalborgi TaxID=29522 RepID=A0A5C8FW06_9SPIR|nr:hypothetical protein [Brachyspira aalborgi]TXJ53836.1 hypothetical protein EPJ76_10525 [Brachyspira aalborgi]
MRVLCDNIFNNNNWTASSSDDFFPIENIFDYQRLNIGKFNDKKLGVLKVSGSGDKVINSFAIFNTNAYLVKIEINNNEEMRIYSIDINADKQVIYNISPIKFLECKITFYGNETNENNLECGYLIIGEAVDFPPHDKIKTHTINYTHNQFFSVTNHYFRRVLPVRKYDIWKVSFSYLTNEDKEKMEKFFDDCDFYPFVLQVWKEADLSEISEGNETISYAKYGVGKYGKSKYASKEQINLSNEKVGAKYYMKAGLYVLTNDKIDFKKGKNDLYQYSTELTFREVN